MVVLGPLPAGVAAEPSFAGSGDTVAVLDGEWSISLNGKDQTTALKPWEELGTTGFAGPVIYKRQFTVASAPAKGKRVYLEIGDVHDYAKVTVNGKDVGERAWQPYRWDVTSALKKGSNDLEIAVQTTAAGRGPGGPPPAAAPAAPAVGLATAPAAGAGGAGGQRRRQGAGAGAPGAGAPPAGAGAGRPAAVPTSSGLLGPVTLVAR